MSASRRTPAFASDDWMFEQQVRAELEAEAWRRLREQLADPIPAPPQVAAPLQPAPAAQPAAAPKFNPHRTGSTALKALVRFMLAAAGAYLAYIAGADGRLGEFEIWLSVGSAFVVVLALSAFEPLRGAVHTLAETARWALIIGFVLGIAWVVTHMSA